MSQNPGRNDPCACGSGRKYKHCCAALRSPTPRVPSAEDRQEAFDLLDQLAGLPRFAEDFAEAHLMIWGEPADDDRPDPLLETAVGDLFVEWFWFDYLLHTGETLADCALRERLTTLSTGARTFLRAIADAPLRLVQVERVEPDAHVEVRDIVDRSTRIRVTERRGSRELVRHDLLSARIAAYGAEYQFEGIALCFPTLDKPELARIMRRLRRRVDKELPESGVSDRLKRMATGAAILSFAIDLFDRPLPQMRTVEGDEVVPAATIFDVHDHARVRAALAGAADFEEEKALSTGQKRRFVWFEVPAAGDRDERRILATLALTRTKLRIETFSVRRAARAQARVGEIVGSAASFADLEVGEITPPEGRRERGRSTPPAPSVTAPELAAVERDFYERHYREWVDVPVPMLGNRTPRQAADVKTLRPTLRALVEGIENQAARLQHEGRGGFDVSWIRKELRLRG